MTTSKCLFLQKFYLMKLFKITFLVLALSCFAFSAVHKYYVSVTQVEYVEEKESIQIISRIFIDDFESVLRERYDESITLATGKEEKMEDYYIERYLKDKINIQINGQSVPINFIGKEYDVDIVKCYLEIEGVKHVKTFDITNRVLFDMFEDQQNIVKTKINSKQKSTILITQRDNLVLKFD